MGTISRPSKASSGTTNYTNNTVADGDEVDADIDPIYTLVNGNLDNNNINASAVIDQSKILNESSTGAEARAITSSGSSASPATGGSLVTDQQRLRHILRRLTVGDDAQFYDASNAQNDAGWQEFRIVGPNLLLNSSFELFSSGTSAIPDHWSAINSPTFSVQATAATEGEGMEVTATAGAATQDGLSQVVGGIKPLTRYLVGARVEVGVGGAEVFTSGAEAAGTAYQDAVVALATPASYKTLSAIVVGDSSSPATDITFGIRTAGGGSDVFSADQCFFYELGGNPIANSTNVGIVATATAAQTVAAETTPAWYDITGITGTVRCPGPGYRIRVDVTISYNFNDVRGAIAVRLDENASAVAGPFGGTVRESNVAGSIFSHGTLTFAWVNFAPAAGTTYAYKAQVRSTDSDLTNSAGIVINGVQVESPANTFASHMIVSLERI